MQSFIAMTCSQLKTFRDSILRKNEKSVSDSVIYFLKLAKSDYAFSSFNLDSKLNNLIINFENPVLENYEKKLRSLEEDLLKLTSKRKTNDKTADQDSYSFARMNDSYANMEKYFFKLLENAVVSYSKEEFMVALEEILICKLYLETVIFFRLQVSGSESKELSSEAFCKILEECIIEDSSFIFDDRKSSQTSGLESPLFFCFLGDDMKNYIKKKAIYVEKQERSPEDFQLGHLVKLYIEIIRMMNDCDKKIAQYNKL
jgi:hypothetical protein